MESTNNTKIPLDIPADQRLYLHYALWSLAKHLQFVKDDFILEAVTQIPELNEYITTTSKLVDKTPKNKPFMLSAKELLAFFACFDLCYKAMNGPEHFALMMAYQDKDDQIRVSSFNDALKNKERSFKLLEPFLKVTQDFAEKNPEAYYLHEYLRIAKRLPLPGSKGIRPERAPFDQPLSIPDAHPEFRLAKYHNSGIDIVLNRNLLIDMNFHLVFELVKAIIDKPDNLPSRIITAYFPDFHHYFRHMTEHINLKQGTSKQFNDIEFIKKNSFFQKMPEVVFGSIYLAFDFALKLSFSDKGYVNYPTLMIDRFGAFGKKMFGKFAADNIMDNAFKTAMPLLADYFNFMTNELDHKGSTLVADYKAFAQKVEWWE